MTTSEKERTVYLKDFKLDIQNNKDYQINKEFNYQAIKNGRNKFIICPKNDEMFEAQDFCEDKDVSSKTKAEILDDCMECWRLALIKDMENPEYFDHDIEISTNLLEQFSIEEIQEMSKCNKKGSK